MRIYLDMETLEKVMIMMGLDSEDAQRFIDGGITSDEWIEFTNVLSEIVDQQYQA